MNSISSYFRGTQFGMLIHYLKECHFEKYQRILRSSSGESCADIDIGDSVVFYKAARAMFELNENNFQEKSRQEVVLLQQGHPESIILWTHLCNISRKEFQKIYDQLDVRLTERGESFYNNMLADTVVGLKDRGVTELSNGATVVFFPEMNQTRGNSSSTPATPLCILQKSDGGYLYATTDLAALQYRLSSFLKSAPVDSEQTDGDNADIVLYVTDFSQADHFEM